MAQPDRVHDVVRLCAISAEPLSVDAALAAIADDGCGGQVVFIGRVRDHDHARAVTALEYEAHPGALAALQRVCRAVADTHDVRAVAAVHRVGALAIGDIAVITAVAAPHRDAAFAAGRELIDQLKATTPIWKHQLFGDGESEWVGLP
ncbi:Molybdopterin synthase catalytic subunit 2 [Nostocoides australiense Ben110]|uniref:Molybdopterin synthase catalytic subunit 2 n=1 Tax=Nostocoides australiense Ben110 TaxID=1193182 RepID=W6JSE5_9MICO|nr:molybdenum cofactor biosynthesis protein MoaE [Tetrasphaera australiensis]CCH71843.1 Molybdopterin synthase catalytic subunit 2 [Tetrasphaera australiensis Ben110]